MKRILSMVVTFIYILTIIAFVVMQTKLTPEMKTLTPFIESLSIFIVISYAAVGIYHIFLLSIALKGLTGRLVDSLFLAGVIFSGITLLSDAVQLSEIGKEYLYFNVSEQWYFLYGFALVHLIVMLVGSIKAWKEKDVLPDIKPDILFISLNQMILISCSVGLAWVIASIVKMPVPEKYMPTFFVLIIGLSFAPAVVFIVHWFWKMKKIKVSMWFDEKQISDIASGALTAFLIALPIYLAAFAEEALAINIFPSYIWIMLLFLIQLGIFSGTVMFKTHFQDDQSLA